MNKTKICGICNTEKSIDQFYFDKKQKYYDYRCLDCRREYRRKYEAKRGNELKRIRVKNKRLIDGDFANSLRRYAKDWSIKNPEKCILSKTKARAKKNNIVFDLILEDIVIPKVCPVLGIPIEIGHGASSGSPSIDRIDPTKGYTKGNIAIISNRANTLKNNGSIDEFLKIIEYIKNNS